MYLQLEYAFFLIRFHKVCYPEWITYVLKKHYLKFQLTVLVLVQKKTSSPLRKVKCMKDLLRHSPFSKLQSNSYIMIRNV